MGTTPYFTKLKHRGSLPYIHKIVCSDHVNEVFANQTAVPSTFSTIQFSDIPVKRLYANLNVDLFWKDYRHVS